MSFSIINSLETRPGDSAINSDPWQSAALTIEQRDNWLLSYIDILTLFLTLLVVLLVLEPDDKSAMKGEVETVVNAAAPPPAAEVYEVVKYELKLPSIPSAHWPDPDVIELDVEIPLLPEPAQFEDMESMPLLVEEAQPETILPQTEPAVEPAPEQETSLADKMMERLATTGLSERLQARKVDQTVQLEVNDNILFAAGSVALKSEGKRLLDDLEQLFNKNEAIITIEGHTDNRPISSVRFPSNWELSSGRATRVARYLIDHGYDPGRLRALGFADTRPLASNETAEGRARNRRVSLVVRFNKPGNIAD